MSRLASLLLLSAAHGFQAQTPSPDAEREKDTYAIYSLMLTNPETSHGPYKAEWLLIEAATGSSLLLISNPMEESCITPPKERQSDWQEVRKDFERRKATPRQLKPALSIPKPYALLSHEEIKEFWSQRGPAIEGKPRDKRFHGVTDIFTLSDVYFNERRTLALTGISSYCGSLCALARWRVFEKSDTGKWVERPWVNCLTMARNIRRKRCGTAPRAARGSQPRLQRPLSQNSRRADAQGVAQSLVTAAPRLIEALAL